MNTLSVPPLTPTHPHSHPHCHTIILSSYSLMLPQFRSPGSMSFWLFNPSFLAPYFNACSNWSMEVKRLTLFSFNKHSLWCKMVLTKKTYEKHELDTTLDNLNVLPIENAVVITFSLIFFLRSTVELLPLVNNILSVVDFGFGACQSAA